METSILSKDISSSSPRSTYWRVHIEDIRFKPEDVPILSSKEIKIFTSDHPHRYHVWYRLPCAQRSSFFKTLVGVLNVTSITKQEFIDQDISKALYSYTEEYTSPQQTPTNTSHVQAFTDESEEEEILPLVKRRKVLKRKLKGLESIQHELKQVNAALRHYLE